MSINQDVPVENAREAAEPGTAEVREIYPGARSAEPVHGNKRRRAGGSDAGMATAE